MREMAREAAGAFASTAMGSEGRKGSSSGQSSGESSGQGEEGGAAGGGAADGGAALRTAPKGLNIFMAFSNSAMFCEWPT